MRTAPSRIEGSCRGALLARWAENVARRFGEEAPARVRARAGVPVEVVPDAPAEKGWFPIAAQLALTDAIVEEHLGGELAALAPLLLEDGRRGTSLLARTLLRGAGPARVLARAVDLHREAYDVGRASAEVDGAKATLRYAGARAFAHPTWQLLTTTATRAMIELAGREVIELAPRAPGEDAFELVARWR